MDEIKITIDMSDVKVNIQCDPKWFAQQMAFLMKNHPEIFERTTSDKKPVSKQPGKAGTIAAENTASIPLRTFLENKRAIAKQNRRFLATAVWLTGQGKAKLKVRDITKSLRESNIPPLKSPASCRYQLTKRGVLQYEGNLFVVTQKGFEEI